MNGPVLTVGMACYRNWDESWSTLEALRTYHGDSFAVVVVDNAPESDGRLRHTAQACAAAYYHRPDLSGTSRPRAAVFDFARTPWVACIDSHVLIEPGGVAALEEYARAHPGSADILTGPLIGDDGRWSATHWQPTGAGLWGVWGRSADFAARWGESGSPGFDRGAARAAVDRLAPFEIPMMGLGLWAMRRAAWPGFHRAFNGFGGEEGYIHEKVRRAGGKALCLPRVRWRHKFRDVGGWQANPAPYPLRLEDHVWNLLVGHRELGVPEYEAAILKDHGHKLPAATWDGLRAAAERTVTFGAIAPPPKPQKILAVWYTNNGAPPDLMKKSLTTIWDAQQQSRHDVRAVVSAWAPVAGCPFRQVLNPQPGAAGHLAIARQIKAAVAAGVGDGWTPDAVAFMEHDVLYPPGYFDRVGDAFALNPAAPVVSHLDYRGLNATGWLKTVERHEPLHQLAQRYGPALANLERCEAEAAATGVTLLEPASGGDRADWVRIPPDPNDRTPAVHVNHGRHLTSHHAVCYEKVSTAGPGGKAQTNHPFWGEHKNWWPGDVAAAVQPVAAAAGGCGGCGKATPTIPVYATADEWFRAAKATPSDFSEHMDTLRSLASKCDHVTEVCSWGKPARVALAAAYPKRFTSYSPAARPEWPQLSRLLGDRFSGVVAADPATAVVEETDLLFLDTNHRADEIVSSLTANAGRVRKYVAVHCTETYGEVGDDKGPGVLPGLRLWLSRNPEWTVKDHRPNNHGLMILSRVEADRPDVEPGVLRLGMNYLTAKFTHWRQGGKFLPLPMAEDRLKTCWLCPARTNNQCSRCGCYLDVIDPDGKNPAVPPGERGKPGRAFYPALDCPLGKWHAIDPKTIDPALYAVGAPPAVGYAVGGVLAAGIVPTGPFVVVSARPEAERSATLAELKGRGLDPFAVYLRPDGVPGGVEAAARHKAATIARLGLKRFYESDPRQVELIRSVNRECQVIPVVGGRPAE